MFYMAVSKMTFITTTTTTTAAATTLQTQYDYNVKVTFSVSVGCVGRELVSSLSISSVCFLLCSSSSSVGRHGGC